MQYKILIDKNTASYYYINMIMIRNSNKDPEVQSHRQTRQRRLLLELISEIKVHIDAKELYRLAAARDSSISPATVYRNLNHFKQQGLIEKKHLGQARCFYEIKGPIQHQHLICSECGKVIDFNCPVNEIIENVKNEQNFIVTKAEIYIEGYCAECAEVKAKK